MKTISILGSTGSIGTSGLDVVRQHPAEFKIFGLSAGSNVSLLVDQAKEFKPSIVHIADGTKLDELKSKLTDLDIEVISGRENIEKVFDDSKVSLVLVAITGIVALEPIIKAIEFKKDVALANKEAIVSAGELILKMAQKNGVKLLPVDSEHSAIWQCLEGSNGNRIKRILLTASGGSFRNKTPKELERVTPEEAIHHPRWKMGAKITVDSGTLMNKGLEVIEAMKLFTVPLEKIEVLIHPQSIIHSAVEYEDGSIIAQMGVTDMRIPIQLALSYPKRLPNSLSPLNFIELKSLTFEKPNFSNFPCLTLALEAARIGGTMPCVLNIANEVAVGAFLNSEIKFTDIPLIVEKSMKSHKPIMDFSVEDIKELCKSESKKSKKYILELNGANKAE